MEPFVFHFHELLLELIQNSAFIKIQSLIHADTRDEIVVSLNETSFAFQMRIHISRNNLADISNRIDFPNACQI
jgi:hypothetical protein